LNRSSVAISTEFAELAAGIRGDGTAGDQWGRIGQLAVEHVPGCTWASISNLHAGKGRSLAASDPVAAGLDQLQFELGEGPCLQSASAGASVLSPNLGTDHRWPLFVARAATARSAWPLAC
jgi:hypothetical protein